MIKRKLLQVGMQTVSVFLLVLLMVPFTGCMSIHTAASAGNVAEVKKQLAWGVNPNKRTFWYLTRISHSV